MSPNTHSTFEALPVEVLGNILRQMASPEDLYSTIRASPRALGSFLWFREEILIHVLQAHLPAEIFAEFLGLLHSPKYEDLNNVPDESEFQDAGRFDRRTDDKPREWEICKFWAWPPVVDQFFESHFENVALAKSSKVQRYRIPQPVEKREVDYLMSTYAMLNRFIRDYQLFARTNINGMVPPLSELNPYSFRRREAQRGLATGWPALSENETLRLQRGFLRYELCCRVNTIPDRDALITRTDVEGMDSFEPLSNYLSRWEEEEVRCVWTYVCRQYQILALDTIADLRCDIRRLSKKARNEPDSEVILAPDTFLGVRGYFFSSWADNMSCYGLPLLQQLLQSEYDDQRHFLKNTMCKREPPFEGFGFLQEYNMNYLREDWDQRSTTTHPLRVPGASLIYAHMIRKLAVRGLNTEESFRSNQRAERTLKECGWVFWEDPARLERFADLETDTSGDYRVIHCYSPPATDAGFAAEIQDLEDAEPRYPEGMMYVTKEDYEVLSVKHGAKVPTPESEQFFLDRLRAISDQPSKEALPSFQEVCSGMPPIPPPRRRKLAYMME